MVEQTLQMIALAPNQELNGTSTFATVDLGSVFMSDNGLGPAIC